jgi:eukaryotic-like serine/threonine-protein kinase
VWPVLVADLASATARDFLTGIALAGGRAFLPLITPPATGATHVLEVYTPGTTEPLVLFAQPLGAPTRVGFPLQLRVYDPSELPAARGSEKRISTRESHEPTPEDASELRAKNPKGFTISDRHSRKLSGELIEVGPENLIGRKIAGGKLIIEGVLGAGGVGAVYLASHRELKIQVAVKVLHEHYQHDMEFCRRFHAEALAASRLDHANLVRVLDFGQEPDGLLYLVMQHLDGAPLGKLLLRDGKAMPLPRIVNIMMQVCAGLAHAHARGLVHRDVKPDNVVLLANQEDDDRPDELVKVCDFGIAVAQADVDPSMAIVGTPDYMSPEQCRGEALDGRSDVYSCGVMLYELATGQMPFIAQTPVALLNRHMHSPPTPPSLVKPEVDTRLEAIILKALAKEPADRQQSMRDLRSELRALLADASMPPASPTPTPPSFQEASVEPESRVRPKLASTPEWLERGGRTDSIQELSTAAVHGRLLATELATRPAAWLSAFAETTRQDQFESLSRTLDAALPVLIEEKNVKALFAVRCMLDILAGESPSHMEWRRAKAQQTQRAFADPSLLMFVAEQVLLSDAPARETSELLLRAGAPGAYALYSVRLKHPDQESVRARFIALIRHLGVSALPMIRAALAKLESRRDHPIAAALAGDLLQASPNVRDDAAGDLAVLYVDGAPADLVAVAAAALVRFWGERATPVLLGLLGSQDDGVRLVSIVGLRELQAIDEHAVAKIAAVARASSCPQVRAEALVALLETKGGTRADAERALELLPKQD